jgi:adenylate kinase family enzyme
MSTTPITLICGIPGTGKSTFARWIEEKKGFLHLDVEKQGALQRASVESAWMEMSLAN